MIFLIRLFAAGALVLLGVGCSTMSQSKPNLTTVSAVDLERYFGRWYVISHTPNFLEKGKVGTADNYARRPDGKLRADFSFRKKSLDAPEQEWKGIATIVNPTTNAEWTVQLLWPFSADYLILELDPEYRWAVVASRGGKWLWVLARETSLPPATYAEILKRIESRGLDAAHLELVPQLPAAR
jgi:apolipoprotein D and lipocalin family protein